MKKAIVNLIIVILSLFLGLGIGIFIGAKYFGQEKPAMSWNEGTPQPSATPEPEPEATNTPELEANATPKPESQPTITPKPEVTTTPKPQPSATPEPQPSITPKPEPTTTPEPQPSATSEPKPEPSTTPEPQPSITPKAEPTKALTPTPQPTKTPERPSGELTPAPSAEREAYVGALHVEGTHLVDSEGTPVQLRGVSTHGLGWFPEYVNESAFRQMKEEWGISVVRLAMYTAENNGYCTSGDGQKQKLRDIVDAGVRAASELDLYVIIDWHILSDGNPNTHKEEAKKFFAQVAEQYADNPHVIYEICNEPNGGVSWQQIKQYALEIIPIIREHAPEAVIIVGTPTWSQDVDAAAKDPITEYDNIMYALHFYADTHRDNLRNKCRQAVEAGLPLFVTEYGICDASGNGAINETEANKWIALLDSYGISHVIWNLSNKAESSSLIRSSCSKKNGFAMSDLSTGGKWFIGMLEKAGKNSGIIGANNGNEDGNSPSDGNGSSSDGNSPSDGNIPSDGNNPSSGNNPSEGTYIPEDFIAYGSSLLTAGKGLKLTVTNGWRNEGGIGLQIELTVENQDGTEETDWVREFYIKETDGDGRKVQFSVSQIWNAQAEEMGNGTVLITPMDYNKTVSASGSVGGIGIILTINLS